MDELNFWRLFMAFLVGCLMTQQGSFIQALTHNPLAESSTLGISALSVLCVMLSHLTRILFPQSPLSLIQGTLIFGGLFLILLIGLKRIQVFQYQKMQKLILIGLCLNLLVGSLFSVMYFLFLNLGIPFANELWFGNFRFVPKEAIISFCGLFILNYAWAMNNGKKLEALSYGIEVAENLGVRVERLTPQIFCLVFFTSLFIHAYFGVFAFLGVVFPQLMRSIPFFRLSVKNEILFGSVIAGLLLSSLDLFCQMFTIHGAEIPVGMLSSVMGSFALVLLLLKNA